MEAQDRAAHRPQVKDLPRDEKVTLALELRAQGLTYREIGERLGGVSTSTVAGWFPSKTKHPLPADAINPETLLAFLDAHAENDPQQGYTVMRTPSGDALTRAIFRWRKEGVVPQLNAAEACLVHFGFHIGEFESWAEERGLEIWAAGETPSWWTDDSSSRWAEDLESSDPEWRAEARAFGVRTGALTADGRRRWTRRRSPKPRARRLRADRSRKRRRPPARVSRRSRVPA